MAAAAAFRTEHVSQAPRGWRVRTVVPGAQSKHEVRIAFPPGRRRKGSGKLIEILHPADERNPRCEISKKARENPGELLIFGNPHGRRVSRAAGRRRPGHQPGCPCFACRHARGEAAARGSAKRNSKLAQQRAARERAARIRSARLNPKRSGPRRRNASEIDQAVNLYASFHGRDPKDIVSKHVSAATRLDYTALGTLEYLEVKTPLGKKAKFEFDGDGVMLASSPDGKQLYCIGGNQNLLACLDKDSQQKDFIDLGDGLELQYLARKVHAEFRPVSYYHKFGELNGALPRLMFDKLKKQIFFVGGEYFIDTSKGVSPGIEN